MRLAKTLGINMAQNCECNNCDFTFIGGHSHHSGYSEAICSKCLTEFALPTKNNWGPDSAEVIELSKIIFATKKKKIKGAWCRVIAKIDLKPTGEYLLAENSNDLIGGIHYPFETLTCPECNSKGSIKGYFENEQICPKCKEGFLNCDYDSEF